MTDPGAELLDNERAARFEAMFDRYAGRVYAYAARRSTPDAANETVGETFLIAWRRLDVVPDDPLPWLLNVAGKVLANRRRSDQRREAFTTERARALQASPGFDPTDAVSTRLAIERALHGRGGLSAEPSSASASDDASDDRSLAELFVDYAADRERRLEAKLAETEAALQAALIRAELAEAELRRLH